MMMNGGGKGERLGPSETLVDAGQAEAEGKQEGEDDKAEHAAQRGGAGLGGDNVCDEGVEAFGHAVAAKRVPDATGAVVAHAGEVGGGQGEGAAHDGGPGGHVGRVAQPARGRVADRLDGPARVCGEDGAAGEHGLEGHDAEMLVGGGVDDEVGRGEQGRLERVWHRQEEDDGGLGRQGGGQVGGGGGPGDAVVGEVQRRGELAQVVVVLDVFGDAGVVAAWQRGDVGFSREPGGRVERSIPARTRRTPARSESGMAAKALMARPMSFLRSKRLMLSSSLPWPRSVSAQAARSSTSSSSSGRGSVSTQG